MRNEAAAMVEEIHGTVGELRNKMAERTLANRYSSLYSTLSEPLVN